MKHFKISEQELRKILNILGESPAKFVFDVVDILRNLPELPVEAVESDSTRE